MNTIGILIKPFGRKSLITSAALLLLLLTLCVSRAAVFASDDGERGKIARQVAQKWMQIGNEQYGRGLFKAAEQSLLRAQDYHEHLSTAEREKLDRLLDKTHIAVVERDKILQNLQSSDKLMKQNKPAEAKALLDAIAGSEFVAQDEQRLIADRLLAINNQMQATPVLKVEAVKNEVRAPVAAVAELKSEDNNLGANVEEELMGAGNKLSPKSETVTERGIVVSAPAPVAVPVSVEGGYIDSFNRKRNLVCSHTSAVVNDAVGKAQSCISKNDYDGARTAIETAQIVVAKNQLQLGDGLYNQYNGQLKQLADAVAQQENMNNQQLTEQKRVEATQSQRTYRSQMEADRQKRVCELMDNAISFQKQQRYEEALGQVESLLAIDPLNDQGLLFKQTLTDMISFRNQLEIQKESDKERIRVLMDTDKSAIPYADELTYPKNWRELTANRKPDEAIGQDPVSTAVYKQLDTVVDLGQFTPEMSFGEAIDVIKNAVDPPLKIFVSWRDLYDNADIDRTTPINMDAMPSVSLGTAMELLLKSVSGGFVRLGYTVENGVVKIATAEELGSKLETLVYDISDLLGRPADFYAQSETDISSDLETAGGRGFQEEQRDRQQLLDEAIRRGDAVMQLLQETVEPESWYDAGGEGTIRLFETKKLIIRQTREVHKKIELLLKDMRKSLGHQVAIEARFLVVGENFLEDIGLDMDFYDRDRFKTIVVRDAENNVVIDEATGLPQTVTLTDPSKFGLSQKSDTQTILPDTGITGNWAKLLQSPGALDRTEIIPGMSMQFTGSILDNLQVDFLLRATQAHRNAKSLTAPKVSVLNGESASLRVQRVTFYPSNFQFNIEEIGVAGRAFWTVEYEDRSYVTGTLMNITPTIMPDKKHVLLNIVTELRDFLGFQNYEVLGPTTTEAGQAKWSITYPDTEISRVETRVSVPDGGTLLLGGQKLTAEVELESGVPILSKIPIIGRIFSNRSKTKDEKILLILVKPAIILQEEVEARALAGS